MTVHRTFAIGCCALVTLGLHATLKRAHAQEETKKGFQFAKDKPEDAPPAVPVVRSAQVRPVKIWELEQVGPASLHYRQLIAHVETVTLYSNGRMRWKFAIKNEADGANFLQLNFRRSYVVDADGESYPSVAREIAGNPDGGAHVDFPAGTKTRFWLEFDAPKKATTALKVLLATDPTSEGHTNFNEIPPFIVRFPEPISARIASPPTPVVKPPAEEIVESPAADADPEVPVARTATATIKNSAGGPGLALAMRAIAKESQRFEGSAIPPKGPKEAIALVFQPDPSDEDGVVAQTYAIKTPTKKTILSGWIMPEATTPSGLIIKMRANGVSYRFSFDGKILSGQDNKGMKYVLLPMGKGPG